MIDKSGSMMYDMDAMKEAAVGFVGALDLSVHRVGIVDYDSSADSFPISDDKNAIQKYIKDIENNQGGTAIHNGVDKAVELLTQKRFDAEGAIVLMTDGQSDLDAALKSAQAAKALGYSFFTVALCKSEDSPENQNLKKMATSEADHYSVFASSKLNSVYSSIASKIGDVNAKDVVITQTYNSFFELVTGSTDNNIPRPTISNTVMSWEMTQLVRGDATLSYQLKPKADIPEGVYPHALGAIYYTDYKGDRIKLDLPSVDIKVSHYAPSITAISPDTVEYKGGETVVITGEHFRPGAKLLVDGVNTSYTYVSDKEIQFVMPPHDVSKSVEVRITNPNGKWDYTKIKVIANGAITAVTPNTVEENTRQKVTITGSGFNGTYKSCKVYFGGVAGTVATVSNETITVKAPALPAGVYEVKVVNADGTTATLADAYTSVAKTAPAVDPCTITSITPNTVEENTAQKVTITGTKFNGNYKSLSVKVGAYSATVSTVSDTSVVCKIPKLPAGVYDVTVVNADKTSATLANGYTVTAKAVPTCTITSITPNTVEENTAQKVTITGTLFNGNYKSLSVKVGAYSATVSTVSDTTIVCKIPKLPAGVYDVTVVNADKTSATLANGYTVTAKVVPTCTITSITPNMVEEDTAQKVTITGTKFNGNYKSLSVKVGTYSATVSTVSDTSVVCKIPKLPVGTYDVTVVNADKTSATLANGYTVTAKAAPVVDPCTITSITPNTVEENTAQKVTITGTKFNGNYKSLSVKVGAYSATISTVSDTSIACKIPALPAGTYDVTVVNADKTSATLANGYTVTAKTVPACTIASVTPNTADEDTVQRVTITGTKFNGNYKSCKVYFGTTEANTVSVSDTEIVCKAPALPVGTYDVKVVNADGTTATLAGAYKVNAVAAPTCTITGLDKTEISANVRTYILVRGTEFNGNYKNVKAYIGTTPATVASVNSNEVRIRTAAMPAGVYDVKIVNADGTSATLAGGLTVL
ncbi:MAG: IPT/TIG domain-containing protein [Oscillospiraceae bacterium]